ncbi:hypothetical protein AAF712_010118 [Marasmius tenuissimus]|uniref:Uncharacterized protein n=1 Tax=Marasmius tenuissimus TaxID=585030 RepID=A0ABR2ZMV2_9AGAR
MVVLKNDTNTEKSLPNIPSESAMSKEREARKEAEDAQLMSPTELPPPSYEAIDPAEAGPSRQPRQPSTPTSQDFVFNRPTLNRPASSPHFPEPQSPPQFQLTRPYVPEPQSSEIRPRALAQSASHSHLRTISSSTNISQNFNSPARVPRTVELFTAASPTPLPSTNSLYARSTSDAAASSTSVNTVAPPKPAPTEYSTEYSSSSSSSARSPSNSPEIPVPTFTPSAKKSMFTTQAALKKRNAKEAKAFVISQVNHLLQNQTSPQYTLEAYKGVLGSCLEACTTNSLYLPSILEEKFIEEHTPLYWSIVQRPTATSSRMPELLQALLMYSSPLVEDTRRDVGRACLLMHDQKLYQALRVNEYFMGIGPGPALSPESEPVPIHKDRVVVQEIPPASAGAPGEFAVTLEIPAYQKRPMIHVEFIAQRRIWRLTIKKPTGKNWKIAIALLEPSAPTYVDSRFILQAVNLPPTQLEVSSLVSSPTIEASEETVMSNQLSTSPNHSPRILPESSRSMSELPSYPQPTSDFAAALYSAYPPEKKELAMKNSQQQQQSSYTQPNPIPELMSYYPDVLKGTQVGRLKDRDRRTSVGSSNSNGTDGPGTRHNSNSNTSTTSEGVNGSRGKGKAREGSSSKGDEFSVLLHEIPALPQDLVLKELRLKSSSMLAPKKEIEAELPFQVPPSILGEDEPTIRARFEARLAKPEKECVIC